MRKRFRETKDVDRAGHIFMQQAYKFEIARRRKTHVERLALEKEATIHAVHSVVGRAARRIAGTACEEERANLPGRKQRYGMWLLGSRRPRDVVSRENPDLIRQIREGLSAHIGRLGSESQLPLCVDDAREGHDCECDRADENPSESRKTRELHTPPPSSICTVAPRADRQGGRMRDRKGVVNFGVVKRLSRRANEFALPGPPSLR